MMAAMLDRAALAARLGITPASVTRAVNRGSLPPPDGHVGDSPWWWSTTIDAWQRPSDAWMRKDAQR